MRKKLTLFIIAVLVQSLILAAIPAKKMFTLKSGAEIRVRTVPYDPYDILSGYYVTLRYDFSQAPPYEHQKGQVVYAVLEKNSDGVYELKSYSIDKPSKLKNGQIFIKGSIKNEFRGNVSYGIEKYYMPEQMRDEITSEIRKWQGKGQVLVDLKVDKDGNPAIVRLIINGKSYEY